MAFYRRADPRGEDRRSAKAALSNMSDENRRETQRGLFEKFTMPLSRSIHPTGRGVQRGFIHRDDHWKYAKCHLHQREELLFC